MRVAEAVRQLPGVGACALVMATDANRAALREAALWSADADDARPDGMAAGRRAHRVPGDVVAAVDAGQATGREVARERHLQLRLRHDVEAAGAVRVVLAGADVLGARGRWAEAYAHLQPFEETGVSFLTIRGTFAVRGGLLAEAERDLEAALARSPGNAEILRLLGLVEEGRKSWAAARERYGDRRAELQVLGVLGGNHEREERVVGDLRAEAAVVAEGLEVARRGTDGGEVERAARPTARRGEDSVDLHLAHVTGSARMSHPRGTVRSMGVSMPPSLSPSSIAAFKECPLAFKFSCVERLPEPVLHPPMLDVPAVAGKSVLLIDDVSDSGRTLAKVVDLLVEAGAEVRSATLYVKPRTVLVPDFSYRETDDWIVFPWSALPPVEVAEASEATR